MQDEFFGPNNAIEIKDPQELQLARTRALAAACRRHSAFEIVELWQRVTAGVTEAEFIVVDVKLHGVPPGNPAGIDFIERLMLSVPADESVLVDVLALRKTFPKLMHQNGTAPGAARSLCLYFEAAVAVLRTWTPERFLSRILWWMTQSAVGALHVADQPLEPIFFSTIYELVLPWDYSGERDMSTYRVHGTDLRPDGGCTFTLVDAGHPAGGLSVMPLEIHLPAVVNGRVESLPSTLGQLNDMVQERGVDLIEPLLDALKAKVQPAGSAGIPKTAESKWIALLLFVPIARQEGGVPEAQLKRAFIARYGYLQLGLLVGAFIEYNGRVFVDNTVPRPALDPAAWREKEIFGLELLRTNTPAIARYQSGLAAAGPTGLLVGVGSLGSAILQLWNRSGWGKWTVLDKDHIRPHNLSRHVADAQHIGMPKATVAASLARQWTGGANPVTAIVADVLKTKAIAVREVGKDVELVVDISTTLDYPRLASTLAELPRHVSAFLTPDGGAAVLWCEDVARATTLLSVEAQYYRAVINEPWGARHLQGTLGKFWSGTGCRDVSAVLPYTRILTHAGCLAEQIASVTSVDHASLRAWIRDSSTGEVKSIDVPVANQVMIDHGALKLYLDEDLIRKLRALRRQHLPAETGGILLGYFDFNINAVVVVDGMPAPSDSISTATEFRRGSLGVIDAVIEANRRTSGVVSYIGEWHSHPPGHSAEPSGTDYEQLAQLSIGMAQEGLGAITLIIGEDDIESLSGMRIGD